jgi:NTP pyrophosphatase (non-canonical NTP hydrolase)
MKHDEYAQMVLDLCKKGEVLLSEATPLKMETIHHAIGIAGEAGEILDTVKKHFIYNKDFDRQNIIEELGDIEFYMEGLRQALGITREETLEENWRKLHVRYPKGYTDQNAQVRLDKINLTQQ